MSNNIDRVAKENALLSHVTRINILIGLKHGEWVTYQDILKMTVRYEDSPPTGHLSKLYKAGMVEKHKEGNDIWYRISSPYVLGLIRNLEERLQITSPYQPSPASRPAKTTIRRIPKMRR